MRVLNLYVVRGTMAAIKKHGDVGHVKDPPNPAILSLSLGYTKHSALRNWLHCPRGETKSIQSVHLNQFPVQLAIFNQMSLECLLYWT